MRSSIGRLLALLSLALPLAANAASVRIQNANYDAAGGKIIVKGVLDAIDPGTPVRLVRLPDQSLLATDSDGNKHFAFQIPVSPGQPVPCTIRVEAGSSAAIGRVRHVSPCERHGLTLEGQVIDDPIPHASVTVTVGGLTYTTVADANGFYSIDIATASITDLVTIEATKKMTSGQTIELVSLAGTFSKLLEDSSGGVLSTDESQKVNVTNVSTAEFVLLVEANGGTAPTTAEELQQAETQVDVTELLELAAVIKLIVDGDVPLPSGYTSALAFIEASQTDPTALETLETFIANNSTAVESMMVEILTTNGLVAGFRLEDIPARYFVTAAVEPGFLPRSGEVFEFSTNRASGCNTEAGACDGLYMSRDVNGLPVSDEFLWHLENGVLELSFPNTVSRQNAVVADFLKAYPAAVMVEDGMTFAECQADPTTQFQLDRRVLTVSFTRYNDGQAVEGLAQRAAVQLSGYSTSFVCADGSTRSLADLIVVESAQVMARDSGTIAPRRFVRASAVTGAPDEVVADGGWAMLVYANLRYSPTFVARRIFSDALTLGTDGLAFGVVSNEEGAGPVSWSIDSGTGDLLLSYGDGWTQRVIVTDSLDADGDGAADEYAAFSLFSGPGGVRYGSSDLTLKRNSSLSLTKALVRNPWESYWQTVVNAWQPSAWEDAPAGGRQLVINGGVFGFRAADVGYGFQGFNDTVVTPSCPNATWVRRTLSAFNVELPGTLNKVTMRYRGGGTDRDRTWSALSLQDVNGQRRLYVLELERLPNAANSHRFPPRPNIYREMTEFHKTRGMCVAGLPDTFVPQQ